MRKGIIYTTTYDNFDNFSELGLSIFIDNENYIAEICCDKENKIISIVIKNKGKVLYRVEYAEKIYAIPAVEEILNCKLEYENYWRCYSDVIEFENDVYDTFNS